MLHRADHVRREAPHLDEPGVEVRHGAALVRDKNPVPRRLQRRALLQRLALQRLLRAEELLLRPLASEQDALRVLDRDGPEELLFLVGRHYLPPIASQASRVPSMRARIFSNAVSRVVDVSSENGAKPQSSVVPSCSTGM